MSLSNLDKLFSGTPSWLRLFNRDYQIKTVMRMNDLVGQKGLSQKEVCERTGWSKGYVSRLLSGRGNLTLKTIAKFEAAVDGRVLRVESGRPKHAPAGVRWTAVQTSDLAKEALARPTVSMPSLRQAAHCVKGENKAEKSDV